MIIKKCSLEHLDALKSLDKESIRLHAKFDKDFYRIGKKVMKLRQKGFRKVLSNPKARIFVSLENGKVAGYVSGHILKYGKCKVGILQDIIVSKEYRGKGFGTALAKQLFKWFKSKKCLEAHVGTNFHNTAAFKFYKSIGFRPWEYKLRMKLSKKRFSPFF